MGKLLQSNVLNSIKFKGYVNVDETEDMRRLYNELNYNEVCLVIPSNK
jgi:hypothetical protein